MIYDYAEKSYSECTEDVRQRNIIVLIMFEPVLLREKCQVGTCDEVGCMLRVHSRGTPANKKGNSKAASGQMKGTMLGAPMAFTKVYEGWPASSEIVAPMVEAAERMKQGERD